MTVQNEIAGKRLLRAQAVRRRYGDISRMTLYRWRTDPEVGFPTPIVINGTFFWDEAALDAFDRARGSE